MQSMKEIILRRTFLGKPFKSFAILLAVALMMECFSWLFAYTQKVAIVSKLGGLFHYTAKLITSILLPETCTLLIVVSLINLYHNIFKIRIVKFSAGGILSYQARLLPVLLISFFLFNPVTQSVRYLLEQFPIYSFHDYTATYLVGTYTVRMYILYLIPVLFIGYASINASLMTDFVSQQQSKKRAAKVETPVQVDNLSAVPSVSFLTQLKAKNTQGETILAVQDCYWFETEERYYYAIHPTGRYAITKTMNELEAELNPEFFFRTKRNVIINLSFVSGYSYWENGKYIVRLQTPANDEIDMPRARLQEFKNRLSRFSIAETELGSYKSAAS